MPAPNRTEPLPETVLLVHGTWANAASAAPAWWQADSDFSSRMNQALEKNGSPARCWADVRFRLTDRPPVFAWTGANRESDRLAARWLLEGPGAIVVGRVIRDSAVGADQGRLLGISALPPEVQQLEPISSELNDRMSAVAQQFTGALGAALHAGLTLGPEDEWKQNVLAHLSDPRLAHSQYYQEQEIIEKIAARITSVNQAAADNNASS